MTAATSRSFPRHTHDQYGIGVIDSGGHASLSYRRQVEAGPGNLIFVNPGEVHDGRAIGARPRTWRMLYVDTLLVQELVADCFDGATSSMMFAAPVFVDAVMRRRFDEAFQYAALDSGRSVIACETALIRLAAAMLVNSTAHLPREGTSPSVRRARQRIDADPSASLTLRDMAREAGLSRFQFLRGFARETGLTPHAYILQRRISLAQRLLRRGMAAAEVATAAGFFDQSHLNRCFVRQFGVTPIRYAECRMT